MHYFLEIYYKLLQINFTHIIIRLLVLSFLISLPVYILILKKIKSLSTAKPYIFLYDFISIATIITLSIAPILTEPTILNSQMLIPMFLY